MSRYDQLVGHLRQTLDRMSGVDSSEIDATTSFLDMGADSLALLQISHTIQDDLGVKVPFRLLVDDLETLDALACYLDEQLPPDTQLDVGEEPPRPDPTPSAPEPAPAAVPPPSQAAASAPLPMLSAPVGEGPVERILARQLELLSQQLQVLRGVPAAAPQPAAPQPATTDAPTAQGEEEPEEYVPRKQIPKGPKSRLSAHQQAHLDGLVQRVVAKTRESRRLTQLYRPVHGDSRTIAGFRRLWKDLCYPLTVTDGMGGRVRDVDGNEYVDLTMGFGALLFGHNPPFIMEAIQKEIPRGIRLGPQSYLAGEVAELICELTGVERVTFCNSGTEAVMTALRIARARTGRNKIAIFSGSYHGIADETLVRAEVEPGGSPARPLVPGISETALQDVMVFRYNKPESLVAMRPHMSELAAVLIEPPRSRTPDIQPVEFLRELRRMTAEHGTALIFDEIVTGFRTHPGGCRKLFDIDTDLVTYGKTVGGGMPIGVVAGKREYMDMVDGGMWGYDDDSFPVVEMTYHAGTFCKHPYTMPASKATLEHLKAAGPALQENLGRRTGDLAGVLDDVFQRGGYPFKIVRFGSLFRYIYPPGMKMAELFFYHLLEHGVFLWEGRSAFLSTAHTDNDLEEIVRATKLSLEALREGQMIPAAGPEDGDGPEDDDPDGGGAGSGGRAATGAGAEKTAAAASAAGADTAPLTEAQEHLWILAQLGDEGSRAYNESMTLHLRGPLDRGGALERGLEVVIGRHEALRASFGSDGQVQTFAPPGPVALPLGEVTDEAAARAVIDREAREIFDLARGPLYRARLLRLSDVHHMLVLTLHHLVSDGYSNSVVMKELAKIYSASVRGETAELPPAVPFSGYARRQRESAAGSQMATAEAYWLEELADPPPPMDLPLDRRRPPLQGHLGQRIQVPVGAASTAAFKAFARREGCTFFVGLFTAYQILLHRLSGQGDLVVGTPAAGQIEAGGGALVGYCVNLLPIRSRLGRETRVRELMRGLRSRMLDAFDHQIYPFQRLLRRLDLPRDASRLPLVSATITSERAGRFDFHGLESELLANDNGGSKFELYLNVLEHDDGLVLDCEYNSYLFETTSLQRWMGQLRNLMRAMAAETEARAAALSMLSPAERHQLVVEWNDTETDFDRDLLIHQLFEERAASAPDAVAVSFEDQTLTYGELDRRGNGLAHRLASLGVGGGSLVAVYMERSLEMIAALLGILKAGGAYVPIDVANPAERIAWILGSLAIPHAVTRADELDELRSVAEGLDTLEQFVVVDAAVETRLEPRAFARDHAYVIFTSGSTGRPKGVVETHQPVINLIRWISERFATGPAERGLFITSLCFDLSVYDVFGLLAAGGSIRIASSDDLREPLRLIHWLTTDRITFWDSAPAALEQFVPFLDEASGAPAGTALERVFLSGDWIPLALPGRIEAAFPGIEVVALGGATEATVWSNHHVVRELAPQWASIPYGRPIANARYYVLDDELRPVGVGVAGDLFIGGPCLSSGYAKAPALTAERYLPDPFAPPAESGRFMYRTGDRARFYADGEIEFLGRLDSQVKVRGYRVELGEIETVLSRHPAVDRSAVLVREDSPEDRRLVAYVTPRDNGEPTGEILRAHLKTALPEYMVPAAFVLLDTLPVTANGKLDRAALGREAPPAPGAGGSASARDADPPRGPAEERIAEVWKEILGLEKIGRDENFFELGGDSILAVRIVVRARDQGLPLTATDVFQYQTVAELAALEAVLEAVGEGAGGDVPGGEVEIPPTPIQRWFFEQEPENVHHFNQAVLLTAPEDLDPAHLSEAFALVVARHDALRLRARRTGDGWRLVDPGTADTDAVVCESLDLSSHPLDELDTAVTAACDEIQAGLDLERGPLVRLAAIHRGPGRGGRLLIAAHHLAVDVLSWHVLIGELRIAYEALGRGETPSLPARTSSFRAWAETLDAVARDGADDELELWTEGEDDPASELPRDFDRGPNDHASARRVSVELDAETTRRLQRDVTRAYRTLVHEPLLVSLSRALGRWIGREVVRIDLEGNAREAGLGGINLGHTVGWFTTLYPVRFPLAADDDRGAALLAVKERLRAIPREGLGHGLLRYGGGPAAERLAALPASEASFLYVGGLSSLEGSEEGLWRRAPEPSGEAVHPEHRRPHVLEVQAAIHDGRLRTVFTYSANLHREATIQRLADDFSSDLRSLVEQCHAPRQAVATPTDFPQADVSQDELDDLMAQFSDGL